MSQDCIFCKIVKGDIPCARVYEDADVLAFMDIHPVVKGHTLVIPKIHCDPITHAPVEALARTIAVVQRVARAQYEVLHAAGVSISQANGATAGQEVPHVHFHVIPRFEADRPQRRWQPGAYDNADEMRQLADRLRAAIT
jgi:histidine triad (HIT) family protein